MPDSADNALVSRYQNVVTRINTAETQHKRPSGSVSLVAVSKTYPVEDIRTVAEMGQRHFAENQIQDAMGKIPLLADLDCIWHFIGSIQSNKCRGIAHHFDWVHSVDRLKVAQRLSSLRSDDNPPLNITLQINLQNEASKAGITPESVMELAQEISQLPNITLRGLMAIPAPETNFAKQRNVFRQLRNLMENINQRLSLELDCLSMGMTNDLEAAIAEGATHVRIGTAIFGPRRKK
ncbi:YggS family pyridoxal phosphate-dependent enzyme [Arenicellales bacterium nBUS_45]